MYFVDVVSNEQVNDLAPDVLPVTFNVNSPNGFVSKSEPVTSEIPTVEPVTSKRSVCPLYDPLGLNAATTTL